MDVRTRRDDDTLRLLGIVGELRHPAKPPHTQDSHGRKGPKAAVKAAVKKVAEAIPAALPEVVPAPAPAVKKKARPRKAKTTTSPAAQKQSAGREATIRRRLAEIAEESAPISDMMAKEAESNRVMSSNESIEFHRRRNRILALGKEAAPLARELLQEMIDRDGSPFGGDPGPQWTPVKAGQSTRTVGGPDPSIWKLRDRYVIADRNTITQNASLRTGDPSPEAKSWAKRMRKMVRHSEMDGDRTVYRGAAMPPDVIMQLKPGARIHDRGMMSTDAEPDQVDFYARERLERTPGTIKTLFEIRVPDGTPAIDVGVGEIVLDHGNDLEVLSSRMDDDGTVHVVMQLVGNSG